MVFVLYGMILKCFVFVVLSVIRILKWKEIYVKLSG